MKLIVLISLLSFVIPPEKTEADLLPTKLRVTVIDGLGNFVESAQVSIYETKEDYSASENAVAVGMTDDKGKVTFKDVKNIAYFIEAKEGEKNNNGEGVKTGKLEEGKLNKVNTVIE